VNEWEISAEESCSDHNFLKYKIGITYSFNNMYNYQGIRYIVKEDKYHEFDRKLVQETLKIFNNINYKGSVEEMDVKLSTVASKENDLEKFIDAFTEALQSACRKTFKTISTENQTKKKKLVPW
jgi:Ni,Fe-hydrogenase maturation factor